LNAKKRLHLRVISSAFLEKGHIIEINEKGLSNQQPFRQAFDGITYFGCKKSLPVNDLQLMAQSYSSSLQDSRDISQAHLFDEAATGGATRNASHRQMKATKENHFSNEEVVNDFIIPVPSEEEQEKHAGRQF
jgi:hypothetical protein